MPDPEFPVTARQRNSEWADIFGPASTNAAQRQRYSQDQELYASDLVQQQEQHLLNQAMRDQTAQNFLFRQKDAARRDQMQKFTMGLKDAEQERKDALLPLQMETEAARAAATSALETVRLSKEKRDATNALKVATDTEGFESDMDMLVQTHPPGSKGFAEGYVSALGKYSHVPSELRKSWAAQADIDQDPDQLMRDTAKYRDTHNTTLRMNDKGKWSIALTEKGPVKPMADEVAKGLERDRTTWQREYDSASTRHKDAVKAMQAAQKEPKKGDKYDIAVKNADDLLKAAEADVQHAKGRLTTLDEQLGTRRTAAPSEPAKTTVSETATKPSGPRQISTQEEFDKLKPGEEFTFNGKRGKKS